MLTNVGPFLPNSSRINGQLVALKVISMNAEEGVPFTAIREGKNSRVDPRDVLSFWFDKNTLNLSIQHLAFAIYRSNVIIAILFFTPVFQIILSLTLEEIRIQNYYINWPNY